MKAAKNSNLDNLKWIHIYIGNTTFSEPSWCGTNDDPVWAAKTGNLMMLKWLKKNGCPWNGETLAFAASNGNLDNMKFLKRWMCLESIYLCSCS